MPPPPHADVLCPLPHPPPTLPSTLQGAAGLITSPISGARRDGVKGALVGVAQGFVGVAVKPVAGVLDLAAKSAEGLHKVAAGSAGAPGPGQTMAAATDASARARARPPRTLGPDSTLQVPCFPHSSPVLLFSLPSCTCFSHPSCACS